MEKNNRIDDIEALRAFAVIFTMLAHTPILLPDSSAFISKVTNHFAFWPGVDLFFAVSGFVIARGSLQRLSDASVSGNWLRETLSFWTRRAFRIWPLSWAVLLIVLLLSALLSEFSTFQPLRVNESSALFAILQIQNYHLWHCVSQQRYNDCFGDYGIWWSLSLEEQFYIALPIALFLFRNRLCYALIVLVLVQLCIPRPILSFLWVIRTDAIGMGVLLAMSVHTPIYSAASRYFARHRSMAVALVIALLFMLSWVPGEMMKLSVAPFCTAFVALISFAIVAIASFNHGHLTRNRIFGALLVWLGSRSYAIYLVHFPAMLLARTVWRFITPPDVATGSNFTLRYVATFFIVTFAAAEVSRRLIEVPLRKKGRAVALSIRLRAPNLQM